MKSMLLLSIHPRHVDAILAGTKRVELRRRRPRISEGQAPIYATSPRKEFAATFRIVGVAREPLESLWRRVGKISGVTRDEFDTYFAGLDSGVAIHVADVKKLREPISLDDLREAWNGFHPPQGFRYLEAADVKLVMSANSARAVA